MSDTVIKVENLAKKYVIAHQANVRGGHGTLRDAITDGFKSVTKRFRRTSDDDPTHEDFWALNDVSFEIKQGDRVGIIGRNGAGKSTLLKILSRITEPTKGRITIEGRVASLLEVGTGFHAELTGRENIFLNGAILGMTKQEIKSKFDEIVAFSEVEKFLDTPVKRYSSGMYVRLAFAVAAHLEPEILIVDEVLAVGDMEFQKKCLGKMKDVGSEGRTVLFVSHNMTAIRTLCTSCLLLENGKLKEASSVENCISTYQNRVSFEVSNIWLRNEHKKIPSLIFNSVKISLIGSQPNLKLELSIEMHSLSKHKSAFLAVDILDASGIGVMQALPIIDGFIKDDKPKHFYTMHIDLPPLIPGLYFLTLWTGSHFTQTIDEIKEFMTFEVNYSPTQGRTIPHTTDHGFIVPPSKIIESVGDHV